MNSSLLGQSTIRTFLPQYFSISYTHLIPSAAALVLVVACSYLFTFLSCPVQSPVSLAACFQLFFVRSLLLVSAINGFSESGFDMLFDGSSFFGLSPAGEANGFKGAGGLLEGTAEFVLHASSVKQSETEPPKRGRVKSFSRDVRIPSSKGRWSRATRKRPRDVSIPKEF